ncbi:MAG: recombinase family protein [Cyanobacteria bacterium RU_5_0]|nr:recombinase family protein [Cyanobacteria bacterium RU_5_0]
MSTDSIWIVGATRTGKTARLIQQFCAWAETNPVQRQSQPFSTILVFAATGDNRLELADRIAANTQGHYRFDSATPLGFFQNEVTLFLPLLAQKLNLKTPFLLRLRPETEQILATRLWRSSLDNGTLRQEGIQEYFVVRRTLDILQLAAVNGTPHEDIASILKQGFLDQDNSPDLWDSLGDVLKHWRNWCLERGLLTYGIVTELYWRYLLPDPAYQTHLKRRYYAILADDLDEYPAIARSLFEVFLDQGIPAAFTYNPNGGIRSGLGADPNYLAGLADRCQIETLPQNPNDSIGATWGSALIEWLREPMLLPQLPDSIQTIQTTSRADLLRQTAEAIVTAIHTGQIQPQEIAVIAPGLDAIARYTLREILTSRGIPVLSLNDQQPLAGSPLVRALLTLLALVYPGLGRLLDRHAISEMLVVLSQAPRFGDEGMGRWRESSEVSGLSSQLESSTPHSLPPHPFISSSPHPLIDPVRAGLLTDHCFVPDPDRPQLLPATTFPRWDRLGYQATQAYEEILQWLETQQIQQQQHLTPNPVVLLDRAIQRFLYGGSHLPYDQLAILRELMETAQHFWEVDTRLRQYSRSDSPTAISVGQFIQLLRDGTITADPYPVRPIGRASQAVILATIYQYRSDRHSHRWQFWLDAGSPFWLTGGSGLFGAPLFLHEWSGRPWTATDALEMDQHRLERQVLDLLCRAKERIYLCYSELATNGQDQTGSLLSLVNAALPIPIEPAPSEPSKL